MKYLKLYEAYQIDDDIKDVINLRMLEDIKDMALEYIDNGLTLKITIEIYHNGKFYNYYLLFNHKTEIFNGEYLSRTYRSNNVYYSISFAKLGSLNVNVESRELVSRVRLAYPNEFINGQKQKFINTINNLYEDMEHFTTVEELISPLLNWNMIEDIKEMSLEYLDENFNLNIKIYESTTGIWFMSLKYGHTKNDISWPRRDHLEGVTSWLRLKKMIQNGDNISLIYNVFLKRQGDYGEFNKQYTKELQNRVRLAYPNEMIG